MTFGVSRAMQAKEEVERNVTMPLRGLSLLDAELQAAFDSAPGNALDAAFGTAPQADDELFF
jgi:hypothetical protein